MSPTPPNGSLSALPPLGTVRGQIGTVLTRSVPFGPDPFGTVCVQIGTERGRGAEKDRQRADR
eukprot:1120936-Rhodomonas_salina.1